MPFYNAELYLADAIRSVFAQTHKDWELILIDDGSTDRSLEIAKSIKDSRVRVFSDGENKKLPSRLNEIVQLAKYDLIARMDADDLMSPSRLECQKQILDKFADIDLVSTGCYSILNDSTCVGKRLPKKNSVSIEELLNKKVSVVHAAILGRKEWFLRNKYDSKLQTAQDYELWVRSCYKNDFNIYLLKKPLYYYREENNIQFSKLTRAYKVERSLFRKYADSQKKYLILKSYFKTYIVNFLNFFKKTNFLLERRNIDLDVNSKKVSQLEIELINQTKLPISNQ